MYRPPFSPLLRHRTVYARMFVAATFWRKHPKFRRSGKPLPTGGRTKGALGSKHTRLFSIYVCEKEPAMQEKASRTKSVFPLTRAKCAVAQLCCRQMEV
jgi:hypothetical protein